MFTDLHPEVIKHGQRTIKYIFSKVNYTCYFGTNDMLMYVSKWWYISLSLTPTFVESVCAGSVDPKTAI